MRRLSLVLAAVLAALPGCASTLDRIADGGFQLRYVDYAGPPVERFTAFDLGGFTAVSPTQLVVWNGPNEAYLVKVWNTCRNLMIAEGLAITSTSRTVSRLERVQVGADTCPIEEIRPLDVGHLQADRKAAADARRGQR
jgi:hypothetical protein